MNAMLYLLLVLSLILCCIAAWQNTARAQINPAAIVTAPAPPPLPPSPVDTFRRILAMAQPDREKFLAALTPEKRQVVMLKLDEYQGLSAQEREARLRALQVRVWVRQLIKVAPSNRVDRLAAVQPAERKIIEARLAEWDRLPAELQKEVLTNEIAIRQIARLPDFMFNAALPPFPVDPRIAQQLNHWGNLSKVERTEILNNFQYFLEDLNEKERGKVMGQHPDVAKRLAPIASLSKEQRERYLEGFKRFAALNPDERQQFLINATHWQKMSPEQRESWRILAKKLSSASPPPPLPGRPGASLTPTTDHASLDLPSR
jgi:hypothetical protein